jgi:hypothetical protein
VAFFNAIEAAPQLLTNPFKENPVAKVKAAKLFF